jgi:hypothetical protein
MVTPSGSGAPSGANPLRQLASKLRTLRERHEHRRRPSGFGFAFADRVDYLDPQRWDALTADRSIFLRRDLLRVIEEEGPDNILPRYALLFRDDKPVAALVAQIVSVTGEHLRPAPGAPRTSRSASLLRRALKPATAVATARLRERILVAGNLLSWGFHGIAFAAGEDPAGLWPGIAEALYRLRRAERLTGQTNLVMVKDVTGAESGLDALHRFSYRPLATEPNMVLTLDAAWEHYDHYLAALDAKYRRNAKDQLKKLAAAGCTLEPLPHLAPHAARLHELYQAVQGNAAVRLVTLSASFLPALASALGPDFRCTVVRRGEHLLGFVTTLRDGDTAIAYYIGFDRAAAGEGLPIYLRLLHATVSDAIAWKCRRISLGRTALEPKATLGGKPEPMNVWLRHRIPTLNWILRGVMGSIPHQEAPERNPFKTPPPEPARKP